MEQIRSVRRPHTAYSQFISPLKMLRQKSNQYQKDIKKNKKRLHKKKYLKEQIQKNHNIFQTASSSLHRSMYAQNIIWGKNYKLKMSINNLKEENSSLRAKIWNIKKENRRMNKQIQSWNLNVKNEFNHFGIPYIDSDIIQKVYEDQEYSIVSTKIQITQLQRQLLQREQTIQQLHKNAISVKKFVTHYDRQILQKKQSIKINILDQDIYQSSTLQQQKHNLQKKLAQISNSIQQIGKKRQKISQLKHSTSAELSQLITFYEEKKQISQQAIDSINSQIKYINENQRKDINQEQSHLKRLTIKVRQLQCQIQDKMGQYVKKKISLQNQVEKMESKLSNTQTITQKPKLTITNHKQSQETNNTIKIQAQKCIIRI